MARPTLTPAAEIDGEPIPTSERLLRAAADLFAEVGYDGVTLQGLAREAGVTTGSIYGNFGSKENFFLQSLAWISERELAGLRDELRAAHEDDPFAVLELWAGKLVDPERRRHRRLLVEAAIAASHSEQARELMRAETLKRTEKLLLAVAIAQDRGRIAADLDPGAARWALHALAVGVAHLERLGVDLPDHDAWAGVMAHLFAGLAAEVASVETASAERR